MDLALGGRTTAAIKERICRSALWSIRREAAKPGSYFWLKSGARPTRPAERQVAIP